MVFAYNVERREKETSGRGWRGYRGCFHAFAKLQRPVRRGSILVVGIGVRRCAHGALVEETCEISIDKDRDGDLSG